MPTPREAPLEKRPWGVSRGPRPRDDGRAMDRPNTAQIHARVSFVIKLLAAGHPRVSVLRSVTRAQRREAERTSAKPGARRIWGPNLLVERTIDNYIAKANDYFEASVAKLSDREFGRNFHRLDTLYGRLVDAGKIAAAVSVVREQNAMLGFRNMPTKTSEARRRGPSVQSVKAPPDAQRARPKPPSRAREG